MNWNHGFTGILIAYGVSAAGVLVGLLLGRAPDSRLGLFPFLTIPVLIVAVFLWTAMAGPLKATAIASAIPYLGLVFIAVFSGLAGKLFAKLPENKNHKRGTILSDSSGNAVRNILKPNGLTLAGQPVPAADETKHFKMIGTTGTGKSTAIRELLAGALERGDRAIIADPDGSYLNRFYDPGRGDCILNPFEPKAARWDLFGEMTALHDADQLSRSLIADTEGAEASWRNYARVFLTSLLRQLHPVKHDHVGELYSLVATTPVEDLRDLLADTPPDPTSLRTTADSSVPYAPSPTLTCPRSNTSPTKPPRIACPSAIGSGKGAAFYSSPTAPTKSPRCAASSAPGCAWRSTKP